MAYGLRLTVFGAFNDNGWGTRPAGMGGAFCAVADDINAPLYNPAGLIRLKKKEATFMYARPYLGLDNVNLGLMFLGYAQPLDAQNIPGVGGINCTNFDGTELYRENSFSISYALEIYQMTGVSVQKVRTTEPVAEEKNIMQEQDFGPYKPFYMQDKGVKFTYKAPSASNVYLVGDFNNWDSKKNPMKKNLEGVWVAFEPLRAGRYEYRFSVDGELEPDENFIIAIKQDAQGKREVKIPMKERKIVRKHTKIKEKITEGTKTGFSGGINLKYLTHKYFWDKSEVFRSAAEYYSDPVVASGDSASAMTVDLGILADIGERLSAGIAVKNLTKPDVGLYYEDKVPSELRFGVSYKIPQRDIVSGLDFSYRQQEWGKSSDKLNIHCGAEKWFAEHTCGVRLGGNKNEVTSGVSFYRGFTKGFALQIDYAIMWSLKISDNAGSHRIGTTIKF